MTAMAVEFQNVSKKFGKADRYAVNQVSFSVEEGEFVTILGSSGCGKTTLLKMINRLYRPDTGTIRLFGEDISSVDAVKLRRKIGYVIQQIGLFPHMTIEQNVAVVPGLLKWDKETTKARVKELLEMVGLGAKDYGKRYPAQLSGGQQQRVGLARALAANPEIMLMDEPFGAVDAITRLKLQEELMKIHKELGKTFLLVTHDMNEAFRMGDRVMVMNEGRICQFASPAEILKHPADGFVSELIASARAQEQFWEGLS